MENDTFKTVAEFKQTEFKEKGSRFINRVQPVTTREMAKEYIAEINKQHYDATHNCFAFSIGMGVHQITQFNDDGEPSGTAGKPILQAITGRELTDVVVIVTRYFGGTKLGTGGLIRAYGGGAAMVLDQSRIITRYLQQQIKIEYSYQYSNLVNSLIQKFNAAIRDASYTEDVHQVLAVRKSLAKTFAEQIIELSAGNINIL